jgi:exopolysaccharide biosynthesis WecB/TagA/CpsF family protein
MSMPSTGAIDNDRLLVPASRSALLWRSASATSHSATTVTPHRLFGITIADTTVAKASQSLIAAATANQPTRVVFANAHVINELSTRPGYRAVVETADRVYADGSGLAVAARLVGQPLIDNVNGTDLFPRLAADAAAQGVTLFLLGGRPGTADAARNNMTGFGLGSAIAGAHHGYFAEGSAEETAAIDAVNASGARIVLVGMGVPLQDEWIASNAHRLTAPVLIGVGGLFDFFAGNISRAPHAMRVIGCEWIWRLALEPRRMARRYIIGNAIFLGHALKEAIRIRSARAEAARAQAGMATQPVA